MNTESVIDVACRVYAALAAGDVITDEDWRTPEEIAQAALMLARDRGKITGADFRIDGGYVPTW
ncbi:hypothetical protein [Nocardia tengchongensis]|uniref:hypothetical protein n=1 Tax=Nocardia tengchongensis TaxID=2055889 RepID=UPI0036196675